MSVYIVAGWMRSGTSMMMQCLSEGGLEPIFSEERQKEAQTRFHDEHYVGNEGGYYELQQHQLDSPNFPACYESKLIKLVVIQPFRLPAYEPGYKVVYMRRNAEEIRQSSEALMRARAIPAAETERLTSLLCGILGQRRDVELTELDYRSVLDNPQKQFERLVERGWPIDARKAAAVVDPARCRYRIESLEVGV